jgi:hypothetical protein
VSNWKKIYLELDEDGFLLMPYGKFKQCTTCGKSLPRWRKGKDPELILYHGYCSRECASKNSYGNYVI